MSKLTRFAVPAIAAISLWSSEASAATFVFGIHVLSGQSSSGPVSLPADFELAFDFPTFNASALSLPSNSGYGYRIANASGSGPAAFTPVSNITLGASGIPAQDASGSLDVQNNQAYLDGNPTGNSYLQAVFLSQAFHARDYVNGGPSFHYRYWANQVVFNSSGVFPSGDMTVERLSQVLGQLGTGNWSDSGSDRLCANVTDSCPTIANASFSGTATFLRVDNASAVPEPASWAMMLAGLALVGSMMRRRRNVRVAFA